MSLFAQTLSKSAEIYLWTYEPVEELYSSYGHNAVRVYDPEQGINYIYNYGTFDTGTKNFYLKFAQGKLNYTISAIKISDSRVYRNFLMQLEKVYQRTITENVINLDSTERQAVFDFLENNLRPENREYPYDFFFDNCATRIRDILVQEVGENLQLHGDPADKPMSFRAIHKSFMDGKAWVEFGIDFLLGAKSDRIATPEERMYIPSEMQKAFKNSFIERNGKKIPLLGADHYVVQSAPIVQEDNFWTSPLFFCWLLFAAVLWYSIRTWQNVSYRFDKFWFIFVGLLGLIVFLMWFATDHRVMVNNWNLLWVNPLHLVVGISLYFAKARNGWLRWYFKITFAVTLLTLAGWAIVPQYFNPAFVPLMLIIVLRCYYQISLSKRVIEKK